METATVAAGCFWGTEEYFRKLPGVLDTKVGYTGGTLKNPGYHDVTTGTTGHAESLEIKFDSGKLSYQDLLVHFFKMHDPTTADQQGNDRGTQYRSAIFFHGEKQKKEAEALMKKIEDSKAWNAKLTTQLAPAGIFYPAEEYHQKYLVKNPGGYDNHFVRELNFDSKK
ncbi:MAG: peptide-methionine (S)-S-oxide reductase MsrA [Deltaproteobacteria bacterium]|nr:peptide-methionine (S)-S-oxide reductase MsrA [Deltaproteobacteria bacterium]